MPRSFLENQRIKEMRFEKIAETALFLFSYNGYDNVTIDMITSVSLDNISPFQKDDAPGKYRLHRYFVAADGGTGEVRFHIGTGSGSVVARAVALAAVKGYA